MHIKLLLVLLLAAPLLYAHGVEVAHLIAALAGFRGMAMLMAEVNNLSN